MPLATSPALYPPMPSASTTRPLPGSAAIESSLCERTMPGSVQVATSRTWVRSMGSELDIDAVARRARVQRAAQRAAEFLAGLEALGRVGGHRTHRHFPQSRGHFAAHVLHL